MENDLNISQETLALLIDEHKYEINKLRETRGRLVVKEYGPWQVVNYNGKIALQSEDFTHDVTLYIAGDFYDTEQRLAYATNLCNKLNSIKRKNMEYTEISCMLNDVFVKVENSSDELKFYREDGSFVRFYHSQDCCECVEIEEIIGDLSDLVGTPILVAEERVNPEDSKSTRYESSTWTFYEFRTINGSVTVRWLGTSNGYYSESVYWYDSRDNNRSKW